MSEIRENDFIDQTCGICAQLARANLVKPVRGNVWYAKSLE